MNRSRRWSVPVALLALLAPYANAGDKPAEEKWISDRALTVSPAPAPVPALKYRLFPMISERKDGNAVPIYLRLNHEQSDAARKLWSEEPVKWNKLPLDQIPLKEAKEFLQRFRAFYQQFDLGARRKCAEWNYTLDQGSVIDIRLPDTQQMRSFVPMMVLRARVDAAEGNFAAAVRALETGFSFSQQVGDGPFLISELVGIACAYHFAEVVTDVVERPGAPNLYWALTAMPRPLIDLRKGMEFEQRVLEMEFPELADLDRPRTAEEWNAVLARFRTHFRSPVFRQQGQKYLPGTAPEDSAADSPNLAAAKKYLTERGGMKPAEVDAMVPAQVLLNWLVRYYRELSEDRYRAMYLPYPQAKPLVTDSMQRLKAAPDSEAKQLVEGTLPMVLAVQAAQARIESKLALLRAVEALRLYAAGHGGKLPERLDQVTEVPIPDDPATGKPLEYSLDGATATLISRAPGGNTGREGFRFRLTVRK